MRDLFQYPMRYFLYCRKSTEDEERQVLSLQSQREALDRSFADKTDIDIVEIFEESKSAKTPGRPVFAALLARVEAGEADGIMSWAPDRLARNSIDGGRIIYLLDTGALRDLKFATYTFENNSQGKFMLSIMFGQSKYYSDALSENVKRGNRTKLENGWLPNRAPLGYVNDPVTRTILPDPQRFPLVRRMFELVLYEGRNPRQVVRIARDEWGFLTPKSKRSGGKPIANSTIYKILANSFYKGEIEWSGSTYSGRHTPIVTPEEFDRIQAITGARGTPHPSQISFPFIRLIKCGACGKMITAERKRNRHGSHYTYYHCTARSFLRGNCREPSVEETKLAAQATNFFARIAVPKQVANWVRDHLAQEEESDRTVRICTMQSRTAALSDLDAQLTESTSLRLRRLLSDEEFVEVRKPLLARRKSLEHSAPELKARSLIEPFEMLIFASNMAVEWFLAANNQERRLLLATIGSNPLLVNGNLNIQATKPFFLNSDFTHFLRLRGVVDADRESGATAITSASRQEPTLSDRQVRSRGRKLITELKEVIQAAEGDEWVDVLKKLILQFDVLPPAPKRVASRRRARGAPRPSPRPRKVAPRLQTHMRR